MNTTNISNEKDEQLEARIKRNKEINSADTSTQGDTGSASESSASVLGAMKPTPGLTPEGKKAEIDDDIEDFENVVKEAFLNFAIDPDAVYTEAVVSGIKQHANELSTTTLPFKVRKLTIERAALKVKLKLFSKKKQVEQKDKYMQYKKRLVEVERALRKIQNSVVDAADRKQMSKAIDDLDKKVTKETRQKLQAKQMTESVNQYYYDLGSLQLMNGRRPTPDYIAESKIKDVFSGGTSKMVKTDYFTIMKSVMREIKAGAVKNAAEDVDKARESVKQLIAVIANLPDGTPEASILKYYKLYKRMAMTCVKIYTTMVKRSMFAKEGGKVIPAIDVVHKDLSKEPAHDVSEVLGSLRRLEKALAYLSKKLEKLGNQTMLESVLDDAYELDPEFLNLQEAYAADWIDLDTYADMVLTEAKKPDDGIMEILEILNKKGYKTKYSCSGHKKSWKEDRNDDGIINGKLSSSARIMFKEDYNFPKPPKYWGFKSVDGKDYLYVLPVSHNAKKEDNEKAFDAWKNKYMGTLRTWVENLPDVSSSEKVVTKDKKGRDIVTESLDEMLARSEEALDEMFWWDD